MIGTGHLRPEDVAAYVDRTVAADERARLEEHLADCTTCCDEIVATSRLRQKPVRVRRAWWIGGSAAAAAVLTLVLVNTPWNEAPNEGSVPPLQRSPDATPSISAISPADGAVVMREEVAFSWSTTGDDDALYHFVLTTEDADSVWAVTTPDTAVALPSSAHVRAGMTYLWYVDALMADGRSSTTGLHSFRIRE